MNIHERRRSQLQQQAVKNILNNTNVWSMDNQTLNEDVISDRAKKIT